MSSPKDEPRHHSSKHVDRGTPHEMSDTELAQRGLQKHKEFHKDAEQETREAFKDLLPLSNEQRARPENIERTQEIISKVTERLRPHRQAFSVLSNGLTDRAMRNTGQMLCEFQDRIEEYRERLSAYRTTIPKAIESLEERKKQGGLRGADLVQINTQIAQLHEIVPGLESRIAKAEAEQDEQVEGFSANAMNTAIFRIKLARILGELTISLNEGATQAATVLMCTSEILFSTQKEPYKLNISLAEGTTELVEREPEEDFSFWSQPRRIREAQIHLRIDERLHGKKVQRAPDDVIE